MGETKDSETKHSEKSHSDEVSAPKAGVTAPGTPERRGWPRFPCEGMAEVIVLGGALRFSGMVRDLSVSGCRLVTEVAFKLERGTQVEVVLLVNQIQFRVCGGVRSTHKARGIGLEFVNVSARGRRHIADLIVELQAKNQRAGAAA